jgi:peptidyl-Lys metalloendopeptidase
MRAFADSVTFRCAVKTDIRLGDVYAYVDPNNSFNVVLGAFFFNSPDTGFCSKPGILVHEISHFTLAGATKDPKTYGPAEALSLARSSPEDAQHNAENFEYFVEALVFQLSTAQLKCG